MCGVELDGPVVVELHTERLPRFNIALRARRGVVRKTPPRNIGDGRSPNRNRLADRSMTSLASPVHRRPHAATPRSRAARASRPSRVASVAWLTSADASRCRSIQPSPCPISRWRSTNCSISAVGHDGGGRELLEEREHFGPSRHLPAGELALDERMPQHQPLGEPRGQAVHDAGDRDRSRSRYRPGSSARPPRPAAPGRRRHRKLPAQVGQPLGAGPRNQGIEARVDQRRLFGHAGQFPGAGNLVVVEIEGGSHLHLVYIRMQTLCGILTGVRSGPSACW